MRRKVSNPLALAVLAHLVMGPMHPYELGKQLKDTGKDRNIKFNRGSLYMVVEQLRKAGFVAEQETVKDTQRPERTIYALTDTGRAELHDWMRELVRDPVHEYPQFGVALSLISVLDPVEAVELLEARAGALTKDLDETRGMVGKATADGVQWIFLVEEEYRMSLLEAELRLVRKLTAELAKAEYQHTWREIFGREQ
ncbi:PadR family transcriptional regulator [Lentzea flaviverrucosa]|uniref:Transcriptional regulator PadR-like family protein n=1 Tax=Lentzea flaviverrucosa TaxID=200379 RepID=A0A1H9UWE5_9PSEU|nr:PadR family transcriptional regulator [Lentzea flaviverrucosa]RDI27698.1 PadR family transcriptional regulator [Lentzea flaviverrucosa]SES13661.1 Transcriptional regulator PadR-like family protein [Lentzea flaviverrucosa]